jgi:hypothetical protein
MNMVFRERRTNEGQPSPALFPFGKNLPDFGNVFHSRNVRTEPTVFNFYSPLKEQEFRFYRYRPGENVLVLEINEFPETTPLALPQA